MFFSTFVYIRINSESHWFFLTLTGILRASLSFADYSQDSDSLQTGNLCCCWIHNIFSTRSHLHCAALTSTSYVYVSESLKWIAGDFLDLTTDVFAHRLHICCQLQEIVRVLQNIVIIQWNYNKVPVKPQMWHKQCLRYCQSSNLKPHLCKLFFLLLAKNNKSHNVYVSIVNQRFYLDWMFNFPTEYSQVRNTYIMQSRHSCGSCVNIWILYFFLFFFAEFLVDHCGNHNFWKSKTKMCFLSIKQNKNNKKKIPLRFGQLVDICLFWHLNVNHFEMSYSIRNRWRNRASPFSKKIKNMRRKRG